MSAAAVDRQGSLSVSGLPPVTSRCGSQLDAMVTPEASVYEASGEGLLTGWLPALDEKDMLINRIQFVEPPPKRPPVPNHILESKIYSTVIRNKFVEASPPVLNFAGFEVGGKARRLKLDIINLSGDVQRMHVIPPQTKYFRIEYTKNKRLVPGFAVSCFVEFRPDEYRYYYDCIRVHSKGEENLIIPIHAFPVMNTSDFPKFIDFAMVPVGESRTRVIPLRCEAPINYEFELTFVQIHPSFTVDPIAGTVPANGEVDVTITFTPTSFQTATAKLQLNISQFLSKPLICSLFGCSTPGLSRDLALATVRNATLPSSTKLDVPSDGTLDPGMLSPLARSRSRKAKTGTTTARFQSPTEQQPTGQIIQREGFVIPPHLNTPHAVATVLNQKRGQLRMKDLQEAMQQQKTGAVPISRQMKETMFESAVRQNVYEERQNQLRWQVKLGDEPTTAEYQDKVLWERDADWTSYKRLRGDPEADEESCRYENLVLMRRTRRDASEVAPPVATFDTFLNNMWATRHEIVTRFQQAAYKVIIRHRMTTRLRALQKYHREKNAGDQTAAVAVTSPTTNSATDLVGLKFDASDVGIVAFPFYVSPTVRDDLAVDALGPVLLVSGPVKVKTDVPYFPLQVPQQSQLSGYTRYDVQVASLNYVKPASNRKLRTGDEDDQAGTQEKRKSKTDSALDVQRRSLDASAAGEPASLTSTTAAAADAAAAAADAAEPCTAAALSSALKPPPAMLQPVKYHPLHIFNPAPGLLTMHTPLPYSVTDPDFHVCPLPRFADCGPTVGHQSAASQKCFLDRQEIIKGVMTWRKFSDTSLVASASMPTLSNVWVPRWGEAFNIELLPLESPPLLRGLDDEDKKYVIENDAETGVEGEVQVHLTMEMVKAEFAAMEKACLQDSNKEDTTAAAAGGSGGGGGKKTGGAPASPAPAREVFPAGRKLPPTNLPSNATGPVPRAKLEADLQTFLHRKRNNLGRRIDSRVENLEDSAKDKSLIAK